MKHETYYDFINRMGYQPGIHTLVSQALMSKNKKEFKAIYEMPFPFFQSVKFYKMVNSNKKIFENIVSWGSDEIFKNLMVLAMSDTEEEFLQNSYGIVKNLQIFYRTFKKYQELFYSVFFEQLNPYSPLNKDLRKLIEG